jgi:rhamnosyltransferase
MMKTIDAMIPVYRPDRKFDELLRRLAAQELPVRRVIVVNTGEENWDMAHIAGVLGRAGVPGEWLSVTHITKEEFDHGGTRNLGFSESDADAILCMTMDALPADRKLTKNLADLLFSADDIAAVCGRQLPAKDCGVIERYTRGFNYPEKSRVKSEADLPALGVKTFFCSNACAMYRRELWEKAGRFPERTIFNEDMIFAGHAIHAGYRIGYAGDARVIHSHNYSPLMQLRRNFDLAVSQAEHPEVFSGIRSEGEGIRLVKGTAAWLLQCGYAALIPELVFTSGCKYLGYLLGKNYRRLPKPLILRLTMNRNYWRNYGRPSGDHSGVQ